MSGLYLFLVRALNFFHCLHSKSPSAVHRSNRNIIKNKAVFCIRWLILEMR